MSDQSRPIVDRIMDGFIRIFGSKHHFAVAIGALVAWIAPVAFMGYSRWNGTIGLSGNTYESTAEYFLAVATLYVGAKIAGHQQKQFDHMEALKERIRDLIIENTDLTKKVLDGRTQWEAKTSSGSFIERPDQVHRTLA
ncbi:MAG: hypothetical protein ACYDCC_04880 [Actinomycetota bacterium]